MQNYSRTNNSLSLYRRSAIRLGDVVGHAAIDLSGLHWCSLLYSELQNRGAWIYVNITITEKFPMYNDANVIFTKKCAI